MSERIRAYIDHHFVRNQYGVWCPNCGEAIDMNWPSSCDACGYPKAGHDDYDREEDQP